MEGDYDYDLIVIGGGPAGEKGAAQAAYFGKRVALVEAEADPGGACVHTGTLPSKTLRETALAISGLHQRRLYGLEVRLARESAVPRLMSRKDAVRDSEVLRIHWNLDRHDVSLLRGRGRITGAHRVAVEARDGGTREITGRFLLIATGSVPFRPAGVPWEDPDVDDSDSILQMDVLPDRMTVIGAGVIGCEYAAMFAALGCRVTVVEGRDRMMPFLDREIAERLRIAMTKLGVEFRFGVAFTALERVGEQVRIALRDGTELMADRVLVAAGRSGNTATLGLEALGIVPDRRGQIAVNAQFQTAVPYVYAAGDVIGNPGLASTGMEQARVAMCHAFGLLYKDRVANMLPYGIYTIPEVSSVGETEQSCRDKKIDYEVGRALYRDNARGKITGDADGIVKLIFRADETRRLLGVHILGERATELVHVGQVVLHLAGSLDEFIDMVFNYPTLSEAYKYAAYDGLGRLSRRGR